MIEKKINVGILKYPGFTREDSDTQLKLANILVSDINKDLNGFTLHQDELIHCNWRMLSDSIIAKAVDIVIDPIIPMPSRHQLEIIPYCKVNGFCIIHKKADNLIIHAVRVLSESFQQSLERGLEMLRTIGKMIIIYLGEGFYDDEVFNMLGVRHQHFFINKNEDAISVMCNEAKDKIIITDEPFALSVVKRLNENDDRPNEFTYSLLFDNCPDSIKKLFQMWPAGFAVRRDEQMNGLIDKLWEVDLPSRFAKLFDKNIFIKHGINTILYSESLKPISRDYFRRQRIIYDIKEGVIADLTTMNELMDTDALKKILPSQNDYQQKQKRENNVIRAIESQDEEFRNSFIKLVDSDYINLRELSGIDDPISLARFINTLIVEGVAYIQGEVLYVKSPLKDIINNHFKKKCIKI